MKITSVSLPCQLTDKIDQVARHSDRSRSSVIRILLERSLTGASRLEALQAVADQGLEAYDAEHARAPGPNPGQVIADSSTDGHARLDALQKIAKGTR
jgi:Arc/MetJ-type ribon-helix-helix transcriptional regulator